MTRDELDELLDAHDVQGNEQIVVHEPGEGFWTIEEVVRPKYGEVRLVIQQDTFFETEAAPPVASIHWGGDGL